PFGTYLRPEPRGRVTGPTWGKHLSASLSDEATSFAIAYCCCCRASSTQASCPLHRRHARCHDDNCTTSPMSATLIVSLFATLLSQIQFPVKECFDRCPVSSSTSSTGRTYCPSVCGVPGLHNLNESACCRRGWSADSVECRSHDAGCDEAHCCVQLPAPTRMIFAFWNTENVPMFQMRCLDNWRRFNPTWTLRLLSVATAPSIVGASNLPPTWLKMAPQLQSDAVRLAALKMFGGVWVDITTLFTRQNALDTMWDEMVAAGKSMRAFVWNDVGPHLVDSYFIMAQKSSSLIAQWHGIFLTYWQTRTVASGIRNHNLFSMLSRWPEMQGMIAWGKLRVEYWSIHVCFLRVQALYEDAQHLSWMDHAYLQNSNETSYYHIDQLCKYHHNNNKKLICMRDQMLRTDLPLSSIALHTPLLKFHGGMVRALDLGTDAKFISSCDCACAMGNGSRSYLRLPALREIAVQPLDWYDDASIAAAIADGGPGPFDLVLGAALQFEQWQEHLWSVLERLTIAPSTAPDAGDESCAEGGSRGGDHAGSLVALSHTIGAIQSPPLSVAFVEVERVPGAPRYGMTSRWS
ncbi:capsular polysaccharide synthesis, partial [Chrysochromulina tobinii]